MLFYFALLCFPFLSFSLNSTDFIQLKQCLNDFVSKDPARLIPLIVRLAFHDLADLQGNSGGPDGCIAMASVHEIPSNAGLSTVIKSLSKHVSVCFPKNEFTFADVISLCSKVAVEMAIPSISIKWRYGRKSCSNATNGVFPTLHINTLKGMQPFLDKYKLTAKEMAVLIVGAHGIGNARVTEENTPGWGGFIYSKISSGVEFIKTTLSAAWKRDILSSGVQNQYATVINDTKIGRLPSDMVFFPRTVEKINIDKPDHELDYVETYLASFVSKKRYIFDQEFARVYSKMLEIGIGDDKLMDFDEYPCKDFRMSNIVSDNITISIVEAVDGSWMNFFYSGCISLSYYFIQILFFILKLPFTVVSYSTFTITFDSYFIAIALLITSTLVYILFRYRVLNPYARLPATEANVPAAPFDLHPDSLEDKKTQGYPDEFMGAFLSSIKVFGYLEKRVFHELARHLQTKKLKSGDILFHPDQEDCDFYVVVDGKVEVFVKGQAPDTSDELDSEVYEDPSIHGVIDGHHLLNVVEHGGTVSSLFSILAVFTEKLELPPSLKTMNSKAAKDEDENISTLDPFAVADPEGPKNPAENIALHDPKIEKKKHARSKIHPDIIARASGDTTLAVIPAIAFQNLSKKFPTSAAHIVQVILARFQRVTFLTLYRYLGLTNELLRIEKNVNELAGYGLPADIFDPLLVNKLRKNAYKKNSAPDPSNLDAKNKKDKPKKRNQSTWKAPAPSSTAENYESDYSVTESLPISAGNAQGAFSHLMYEPDELNSKTKELVYECMCWIIGVTVIADENEDNSSLHNSSQGSTGRESITSEFKSLRKNTRSSVSIFPHMRKLNTFLEDESLTETTISPTSSVGNLSVISDRISDIQIMFYTRGSTLIKEGERTLGLYFVIEGILEASMNGCNIDKPKNFKKSLYFIPPGGLAGYLAAITGHVSFVSIVAKTDCCVGFMPKCALDFLVEKYPAILLCLAKRLVNQVSPLVLHIDIALEWGQINAGQVLCRQGEESNSIYIVLTGRLRSIIEKTMKNGKVGLDILGEYGQGESVGEMEVLTELPRASTIHAIRDTEIAIMPSTLFNALAIRHPEITISIARIIATRSHLSKNNYNSDSQISGVESGNNNVNLKTVAILPVCNSVPIVEFANHLKVALELIGASIVLLHTATVTSQLGKHAFNRIGQLKLASWLAEQEDTHTLVLYVADGGVNSPWTTRCVRQADCILLVGLGDEDAAVGEFERLLIGMKTTARKELVLLHSDRLCQPGSTAKWLKNRLWIHAHHHVQMKSLGMSKILSENKREGTFSNLQSHFSKYYSEFNTKKSMSPNIFTGVRSDFARLARRILSKSVGLVLGGGGARGISQVGIIRALEEAGIPIDMVGGTSIGSFVAGLYSRENDHVSVYGRAKMFSSSMSSKLKSIMDLTYPVTAMFTGHAFNRAVWKCFHDTQIEDCWLSYFAVTTNITWSRMEIHQTGYMWRYVRASMSLSGYLPPLCDNGNMLLDGGYINNLPADIMRSLGASTIIAVDVGRVDDTSPVNYGDSLSGWWVLFNRYNPFKHSYGNIPQMAEIQSRLAYVSSVKQLEDAKKIDGCFYVHPDVNRFETMAFDQFNVIFEEGYKTGKELVEKWKLDGTMEKRFNLTVNEIPSPGRRLRRASI